MAECFLVQRGGAPLNFKVVPNPMPSTAKENTIWVDTDKINNYYFSAEQPENMVDYDIWFTIGTSSQVAFFATKKNLIMVYPLSAKQYISGVLVDKPAKSYQGGAWVDWWDGELYDAGNEYNSVTGGWKATSDFFVDTGTRRPDLVEKTSECIILNSAAQSSIVAVTSNKIDLSKYSTLCFDVHVIDSAGGSDCYGIISAPGDVYNNPTAKVSTSTVSRQTLRLDISAYQDSFYVFLGSGSRNRKIYKVWME